MNTFANSLLSLLLSWMRSFFSGLLAFLNGGDGGFFAWLGKHWVVLAVFLIAFGVAIDALIYLLRWRPQYVWRTRLRRVLRREDPEEEQFSEGFDTALPDFNFGDTPIPDLTAAPEPMEMLDAYYTEPAQPAEPVEEIDLDSLAEKETPAIGQRRRRSDRHSRKKLPIRLPDLSEIGRRRDMPPVDARSAFHDPVYPASELPYPYPNDEDDLNV